MFIKYYFWFKVFTICLFPPYIRSIQLRLANSNKDNSYASNYNNYEPDAYNYNYDISNPTTGDHKIKWEKRENDVVRGAYSLVDPDGSIRLVEYTADANGFHPVVTRLDSLPASLRNSQQRYNNNAPTLDAHNFADVTYRDQPNNPRRFGSNHENIYNDRRYVLQSDIQYRTPILNNEYNNAYIHRTGYSGYDGLYKEYDGSSSGAPYHLPLRQERQPVPLLHSAYHGYDNLYH